MDISWYIYSKPNLLSGEVEVPTNWYKLLGRCSCEKLMLHHVSIHNYPQMGFGKFWSGRTAWNLGGCFRWEQADHWQIWSGGVGGFGGGTLPGPFETWPTILRPRKPYWRPMASQPWRWLRSMGKGRVKEAADEALKLLSQDSTRPHPILEENKVVDPEGDIPSGKGTRVAMFSARFDGGPIEQTLGLPVCASI